MTAPDEAARTVTDAASGASTEPDPRIELIFDEARRALDRQALRLESLRTRAGTIVAAGALGASFLGAQALRDRAGEEAGIWSIAGMVSLVVVIASIVFVLAPRDGWRFVNDPKVLIDKYVRAEPPETIDGMRELLAEHLNDDYSANESHLKWLYRATALATLALGAEVLAFLLAIRLE